MSKIALITGGSSGLGFSMAKNLAGKGYIPVICARNGERIEQAVNELRNAGHEALGFQCDVTDEAALRSVSCVLREQFGKIDFLILNAGVVTCSLLEDYPDSSSLRKDLETDLWGTMLSAYIFLKLLAPGSKVLMISSGFGLMGPAGYSAYAAAKAGVINFAESLRRELLHKKIAVYVTCPGDMDTPQLHEEIRSMPSWMKKEAPRGMMHPDVAAEKILKKCSGGRFMIIINFELMGMILFTHLLPRRIRDAVIDRLFPLPS